MNSSGKIRQKINDNLNFRLVRPFEDCIYYPLLGDEEFTRRMYRRVFSREIDLRDPKTFNEKINYLKLYDHNPIYHRLVDKFEVRRYLTETGFGHLLNDLYGVYERVEDINLDQLPEAFIIKPTHTSGLSLICEKKTSLRWDNESGKIKKWLKVDFYKKYREWVYKDLKPRLIIEKVLYQSDHTPLVDYKFHCFNGSPQYIRADQDMFGNHRAGYYDLDWKPVHLRSDDLPVIRDLDRPSNLAEMAAISASISKPFPYLRVDLYNDFGKTIFGELTFFPDGGFMKFTPDSYDAIWGGKLIVNIR